MDMEMMMMSFQMITWKTSMIEIWTKRIIERTNYQELLRNWKTILLISIILRKQYWSQNIFTMMCYRLKMQIIFIKINFSHNKWAKSKMINNPLKWHKWNYLAVLEYKQNNLYHKVIKLKIKSSLPMM